ncbi:MAG: site-specific integrase [Candidatus Hydrogenedentes bacterium]|nr:site-specific integrase [Candidatus Hydrogenedentota bacterium]
MLPKNVPKTDPDKTPERKEKTPKLCTHAASGRAFVRLSGHQVYLCRRDDPDCEKKYGDMLSKWRRGGYVYPFKDPDAPDTSPETAQPDISVAEVCAMFLDYAKAYYVKADGSPSGQIARVQSALNGVLEIYADIDAGQFGPTKLDAVRERWIAKKLARTSINAMTGVVKLAWRWAAAKELIPAAAAVALGMLGGLKRGRSLAKEPEPVRPVLDAHVDAIQPYVSRQVWAMVQLQRYSGARPGEVVVLKANMINRTGAVWTAELAQHKTAYRGRARTLYFGPKAQEILKPWLLERPVGAFLFSPRHAEAERHAAALSHRRPDQMPNAKKSTRVVGDCYSVLAYAQAVRRGCERADTKARKESDGKVGVPSWSPNQLRHTAATRIRQEFGLEGAQVALGHSSASTTEIYAEVDARRALDVFSKLG